MEGNPTYTEPVEQPDYTVESYSAVAMPVMEPFEDRTEDDNDGRRPQSQFAASTVTFL